MTTPPLLGRRTSAQEEHEYRIGLVALAERIVSSRQPDGARTKTVILLEHHGMFEPLDIFIYPPARDILRDGDFNASFTELDPGYSMPPLKNPPRADQLISRRNEARRDAFLKQRLQYLLHDSGHSPIEFLPIGADEVSVREIWDALHPKGEDEKTLLLEQIYIGPRLARDKTGPADLSLRKDLFYAILRQIMSGKGLDLIAQDIIAEETKAKNPFVLERARKDDFGLQMEFIDHLSAIQDIAMHFRRYGRCDEESAKAVIATPYIRAAAVCGNSHGLIARNPAALPDQIVAQSGNASMEIILLLNNRYADDTCGLVRELAGGGILRENIIVWDIENRRETRITPWLRAMNRAGSVSLRRAALRLEL